nr:PREDICTED: peroxisomal membrane protein 11B isoform X1 [Bemisia tabaci]
MLEVVTNLTTKFLSKIRVHIHLLLIAVKNFSMRWNSILRHWKFFIISNFKRILEDFFSTQDMNIPMDEVIKLNNLTAGRDKLARLLQYASRAVWYFLQKRNLNQKSMDKLKNLEYHLSTFRKLLRLGRSLDVLYGALNSLHYSDRIVSATSSMSKVAHALYLLCDHIIWFSRVGLMDVRSDQWLETANRYWLYSIVMSLVRDLYELQKILKSQQYKFNTKNLSLFSRELSRFAVGHKDVVLDSLKNLCDVFIPLAALGYVKLSPGTVGVLGVISSAAGLYALIDPFAKLAPS